ncbi:hypothetical protein GNI_157750 [Gregarina niphandrodes]|uniref:Uncharacterized protein n=1 Tax=Gregarina niphandrodes TaxID=110365 RepID=A0A023AYR5_GRENI|nr:hypothetical protein GNI_157750 [Gregarina niphandrodes]EZG43812.1 hypothetical protein GNI_157750 [Gregarina niphandrodes]|eukprot:XP_011132996.1 hypothetical protein GNI_157750 [Gregarina niphandrodes]
MFCPTTQFPSGRDHTALSVLKALDSGNYDSDIADLLHALTYAQRATENSNTIRLRHTTRTQGKTSPGPSAATASKTNALPSGPPRLKNGRISSGGRARGISLPIEQLSYDPSFDAHDALEEPDLANRTLRNSTYGPDDSTPCGSAWSHPDREHCDNCSEGQGLPEGPEGTEGETRLGETRWGETRSGQDRKRCADGQEDRSPVVSVAAPIIIDGNDLLRGQKIVKHYALVLVRGLWMKQLTELLDEHCLFTSLSPDLRILEITSMEGEVVEFPLECLVRLTTKVRTAEEKEEIHAARAKLRMHTYCERRVSYSRTDENALAPDFVVMLDFPGRRLAFVFNDPLHCERFSRCVWIIRNLQMNYQQQVCPPPPFTL